MTIGIHGHTDQHEVVRLSCMLMLPFEGQITDHAINRRNWSAPSTTPRCECEYLDVLTQRHLVFPPRRKGGKVLTSMTMSHDGTKMVGALTTDKFARAPDQGEEKCCCR